MTEFWNIFPLNDDRFNQKNDDTDIGIKNENALALIKVSDMIKELNDSIKMLHQSIEEQDKEIEIGLDFDSQIGLLLRKYIPISCIGEYLKKRYESSTLVNFIEGINLHSDDMDIIVNVFALIQALLLTISPALMLSLTRESWNDLYTDVASCNIPDTDTFTYNQIFVPLWNFLIGSMTAEILGLFLSVQYFVLRPKGKATFTKWWKRGFYGVLLMVAVMCITLFCTIVTLTFFLFYIVVPQSQLCLTLEAKYKQGSVIFLSELETIALILVALFVALVLCLGAFFFA